MSVSFVRFYAEKWRNGCATISLEAEGLYIRIASFRWDAGRLVPSDRKKAAQLLRVNFNKYSKVLNELIAEGLVKETSDGLIIDRAETEYEAASGAIGRAVHSTGCEQPEDRKTDPGPERPAGSDTVSTPPPTPQVTGQVAGVVAGVVAPPVGAENVEQNQCAPIELRNKEEGYKNKDNILPSSLPTGRQELKTALNGATDAMIADVLGWMGPTARIENATKWLTGTVAAYGSERTSQAWTIVTHKIAVGEVVANPLSLWSKTAQGIRASRPDPAERPKTATRLALDRRLARQSTEAVNG